MKRHQMAKDRPRTAVGRPSVLSCRDDIADSLAVRAGYRVDGVQPQEANKNERGE